SARRARIYTMNQYLTAARVDEFKYIITAQVEGGLFDRGYTGGFSGSIVTETGGAVMVNLYTNPREDVSVGVRHLALALPIGSALSDYMLELGSYPPKFDVGFMSNNPPLYSLGAEILQTLRLRWSTQGPVTTPSTGAPATKK
ncbi:MAG: arylsulfatase, partial [Hyphomicrobiales bacterium]|nr:arylsulfatase [Hyphomicrobiales bacterium]